MERGDSSNHRATIPILTREFGSEPPSGVPSGLQEKAPLSAGLELARGWRSLLARPSEAVAASGTVDISSSITRRGTNPAEGSHGNSQVAPTTDSLAGAPIVPASPSPERGERSPSQE